MGFLMHILGLDNASGPWYLLWSGIVGDLELFALPYVWWRHHNCHRPWCFRIGRHIDGTQKWCMRHMEAEEG